MAAERVYEYDVTGKALRALYKDIAEGIASGIVSGGRRFHAVFPPGTDRARIVSYVMSAARLKTVIVAPNAASRDSWRTRRARIPDLYDAAASTWTNVPGQMISSNPYSCAPVLTLSYRQLSQGRLARQEQEAVQRFTTHAERQGYKLVVLDECTSLPDEWSEEFMAFVRSADAAMLAFSSYPPGEESAWYRHCSGAEKLAVPVTVAALQGALAPYRHHVLFRHVPREGASASELLQSAEKVHSAMDIAEREVRRYGKDTKIAMLMDARALTHVRSDGLLDGLSFMRAAAGRAALGAASTAMLTGASIIVPAPHHKEAVAAIQREAQSREWELELQLRSNEEFTELSGEGRDWNSASYVEIVRALMRQGLADFVLCSAEILPWGVQAMPFNTVIDLTSEARQRYLHVPEHPTEVAVKDADATVNYWDIVCLNDIGGPDWERLLEKHAATECPTEERIIAVGPGAVDISLPAMNPAVLIERLEEWNGAQFSRAVHRKDWAKVWRQTTCGGEAVHSVIVVPWEEFPKQIHCEAVVRDSLAEEARMHTGRKAGMKLHHTLWTVGGISAALIGFLVFSRDVGMVVSGAALLFLIMKITTKWWSVRGAKPRMPTVNREEFVYREALAVYEAVGDSVEPVLPGAQEAVHLIVRADGSYRILFGVQDAETAEICRTAFAALFNPEGEPPAGEPAYRLEVQEFDSGNRRLQTVLRTGDMTKYYKPEYTLPVPPFFCQSRAHAEVFRAAWEERVGRAVLHHSEDVESGLPSFRERYPASVRISLCKM